MAAIENDDGTWSYPFTKKVRSTRLTAELQAAIPGGVVLGVNASESAPYNGSIHTSRELTSEEVTTGTQVVQAHDATEPDGSASLMKAARQAALGLEGVSFASMTIGQLRTVIALLCVTQNAVKMVGGVAQFTVPPGNPLD